MIFLYTEIGIVNLNLDRTTIQERFIIAKFSLMHRTKRTAYVQARLFG